MATYDEQGRRVDEGFIGFGKKLGSALTSASALPSEIGSRVREAVSPALTSIAHGDIPARTPRQAAPSRPSPATQQAVPVARRTGTGGGKVPAAVPSSPANYLRNEMTGKEYGFKSGSPTQPGAGIRFKVTQTPEEEAMSAYEQTLGRFKGGTPALALAANLMTKGVLRDAAARRGERGAMERAALTERGAASRAKVAAAPSEESMARAALLREQAKGAGYTAEEAARSSLANRIIMNPQDYTPNQLERAKEFLNRKQQQALEQIYARTGELQPGVAGYADGGVVGGRTKGMVDPVVSKYGQYLSAAASAGVPPVPFNEYINLLGSTKSAMRGAPATFADGGEVDDQVYTRPKEVDWGGVVGRGVKRMFGMGETQAAPQPAPAPQVETPPAEDEYEEGDAMREADAFLRSLNNEEGYADGGAINVSGKHVRGPGTGRSDSIPAIINGNRPAKLSDGEFVIPAHVVKAKGTEFFEKLLAQYENKV